MDKIKKVKKKIMDQSRGENMGGGKKFFYKALPPQGKFEMAPLPLTLTDLLGSMRSTGFGAYM